MVRWNVCKVTGGVRSVLCLSPSRRLWSWRPKSDDGPMLMFPAALGSSVCGPASLLQFLCDTPHSANRFAISSFSPCQLSVVFGILCFHFQFVCSSLLSVAACGMVAPQLGHWNCSRQSRVHLPVGPCCVTELEVGTFWNMPKVSGHIQQKKLNLWSCESYFHMEDNVYDLCCYKMAARFYCSLVQHVIPSVCAFFVQEWLSSTIWWSRTRMFMCRISGSCKPDAGHRLPTSELILGHVVHTCLCYQAV